MSMVPQSYMALASHGGSCERGRGDQCSRQKFKLSHSISPLDMKANSGWPPLRKWSSDRPIQGTFPHVVSTPREVGAPHDHEYRRQADIFKMFERRAIRSAIHARSRSFTQFERLKTK